MGYKAHSQFTEEVGKMLHERLPSLKDSIVGGILNDVVYLSRMGLLPEAATIPSTAVFDSIVPTPVSVYRLGDRSIQRLQTLKPELASCVKEAIKLTTQDFTVLQTSRTLEEQKKAVAAGNSRTMHSKHLPQSQDKGFAWACDLGAWVNGAVSWDFKLYADIAYAMDRAATALGFAHHVRWGCAWDRVLADFGGSPKAYLDEAAAYAKRHAGSDLIDAPHFEWVA